MSVVETLHPCCFNDLSLTGHDISLALIGVLGLGLTAFWQYQTAKVSEIQVLP